jgi:hypothetical protein
VKIEVILQPPEFQNLFVTTDLAELWNGFGTHFVEYKKPRGNTIVYVCLDSLALIINNCGH